MTARKLTALQVKGAKPKEFDEKAYKLFDGQGLYLLVNPKTSRNPKGSKYWRFKYRFHNREKSLSFGVYPEVSLADARGKLEKARKLLQKDPPVDPSAKRKSERRADRLALGNTFKGIAEDWLAAGCPPNRKGPVSAVTVEQLRNRLEKYVYPWVGDLPIKHISKGDVRSLLTKITRRGKLETAHRVRSLMERIYDYAALDDLVDNNYPRVLKAVLSSPDKKGFAAETDPVKLGAILNAIDGYHGDPSTIYALKLLPYFFVRPKELRFANWSEFDLKVGRWNIPGEKMKMRRPHIVPISKQAKVILKELKRFTGSRDPDALLFPGLRSPKRPISDNTLNAALRRLGISQEQQTSHGFRHSASTILNELGHDRRVIDLQLAHKIQGVEGVYNRAELIKQRTELMQAWADHLDEFKGRAL